MPELILQTDISVRLVVFDFTRALLHILVICEMRHDFDLAMNKGNLTEEVIPLSPTLSLEFRAENSYNQTELTG